MVAFERIESGNYHPKGTSGSGVYLLRDFLEEKFGKKCFSCGNAEWMGKEIPLDIHHKDGDCSNNKVDNVQFLCKNCHALTDTFGTKNKNGSRKWRRSYEKKKYAELTAEMTSECRSGMAQTG